MLVRPKWILFKQQDNIARDIYANLTNKIWYKPAIGKSSRGELEVSLSIRPEVCLVQSCGVDVVVVTSVQERISKDE